MGKRMFNIMDKKISPVYAYISPMDHSWKCTKEIYLTQVSHLVGSALGDTVARVQLNFEVFLYVPDDQATP